MRLIPLVFLFFVAPLTQADGYLDPVEVSPEQYRVLLEDGNLRMLEMNLPPGTGDARHSHPFEMVYFVTGGTVRIHPDGADPIEAEVPDGYALKHAPWTHRVENIGDTHIRAVIFESFGTASAGLLVGSAGRAEFVEVAPGIAKSVIWGDHDGGPYGAYTRFAPGTDAGRHSHSSDVSIVVLQGAYLYRDETGEHRIGAGDFITVPAGAVHWSGGDETEGALFYETASGAFDLVPAR